jgi:hypothetical protein
MVSYMMGNASRWVKGIPGCLDANPGHVSQFFKYF